MSSKKELSDDSDGDSDWPAGHRQRPPSKQEPTVKTPSTTAMPLRNQQMQLNSRKPAPTMKPSLPSKRRPRRVLEDASESDDDRPLEPPIRRISNFSVARLPPTSRDSMSTYYDHSENDEGTTSTLDLIVSKKYAANRGAETQEVRRIPLPPPPPTTQYSNLHQSRLPSRPVRTGVGVLLENIDNHPSFRNKQGQGNSAQISHEIDDKLKVALRTGHVPTRTDSQSTVPSPPSLREGGRYTAPGAFRMTSGGVQGGSDDTESLLGSIRSYPTARTRQSRRTETMVEASLVSEEFLPDDECPSPPAPVTYGVSTGDATHYTHLTTATTFTASSPVFEAHPLDEGQSIRNFFRTWKVRCIIFGLFTVFIILALGTAYGVTGFSRASAAASSSDQGESGARDVEEPTSAPTSEGDLELEYFVQVAIPDYTRAALRKPNSPQSKAFQWLKHNNTNLSEYSTSRRLQRFALATFFFATGGERRWMNNSGWLSDDDECTWYYRSERDLDEINVCDEGTNLKQLSLVANNMRGTFPSEISLLTSLELLEMPQNILTGFLPTTLGEMTSLSAIRLFDNYLSGTLPSELGSIPNLEFLDVEFNFLAQILPETLGRLTNLKYLLLDRNLLRGSIPREFGDLSSLDTMYLFSNDFSGTIPPELGNLSNLQNVRWEANRLSGALPPEIGQWTNLVDLNVGNNTLSGTIPSELGRLTQLSYLDLFRNYMTGIIPTTLGLLSNLQRLYLEENKFEGTIPTEIGGLQDSLEILWLYSNELTGMFPTEVGLLTKLTSLDVSFNDFNGEIPTELGLLVNLETLSLEQAGFSGALPSELGNLSSLNTLSIYGNRLNGTVPEEICQLTESGSLFAVEVDCLFLKCSCCTCI